MQGRTGLGSIRSPRLDWLAPPYDHDFARASFPGAAARQPGHRGPSPDRRASAQTVASRAAQTQVQCSRRPHRTGTHSTTETRRLPITQETPLAGTKIDATELTL